MLSHSRLTQQIFYQLERENRVIIQEISWKKIIASYFKKQCLTLAQNISDTLPENAKVVIFLRDSILFSELVVAHLLCGKEIILLDPEMGREVMQEKLKASQVTHIYIEGFVYDYFFLKGMNFSDEWRKIIILWWSFFAKNTLKLKHFMKENSMPVISEFINENIAAITVFTGGTTGNPKGVVHSYHSIFEMLSKIQDFIQDSKVYYADMPHFLLLWIVAGAEVISGPYTLSGKKLEEVFQKYEVDTYFSPPYKYNYFIEDQRKIPKTLRHILLGSAPIYTGFLQKLLPLLDETQKVTCVYGMTELLPIASIDGREKLKIQETGDVLWRLLPHIQYTFKEWEFLVSASHQMLHYLGSETTKYIETGDLVEMKKNLLIMKGRKKDMIIRKEYNIYPWVYEPIISKIPGVSASAMFGVYDEKVHDERVILALEIEKSQIPYNTKDIIYMLKSGIYSIDTYALPDEIIFCNIPRSGRQQKIDKKLLKKQYQ